MRAHIEDLERDAERAQLELAEELEKVRRSFRAELVPVSGSTALVRASSARTPFPFPKH